MRINIIGDIHGNFKEFKELISIMPKTRTISLGDVIDRGNDSLEVIDYLMKNNIETILGNHDDMFLRANGMQNENIKFSDKKRSEGLGDAWKLRTNGGFVLENELDNRFKGDKSSKILYLLDVMEWFRTLPLQIEIDNVYLSHAPFTMKKDDMKLDSDKIDFLWNYPTPNYLKDKITIHGHTGKFNEFFYYKDFSINSKQTPFININRLKDGSTFIDKPENTSIVSIGIDSMNEGKLTGINIDTETGEYETYFVEFGKETFSVYLDDMKKQKESSIKDEKEN